MSAVELRGASLRPEDKRPASGPANHPPVARGKSTTVKKSPEPGLFDATPSLPQGFRYERSFLTLDEEAGLLRDLQPLPFKAFEFQGFVGNRRVVSFGWKYDFNDRRLQKADDMPAFLLPLRARAAAFAGLEPTAFQHALVTEYSPGAAIGWHRDKAVFD